MDNGSKNIAFAIGGAVAGMGIMLLAQHWKSTIAPGIGKVSGELRTLANQYQNEIAIFAGGAIFIGILGYAVYKFGYDLTSKPIIIAQEPANPLPILKKNLADLVLVSSPISFLKEELKSSLKLSRVEILKEKVAALIKTAEKLPSLSADALKVKLNPLLQLTSVVEITSQLINLQGELSNAKAAITKTLAAGIPDNPFVNGKKETAFLVCGDKQRFDKRALFYRAESAKIKDNMVTYLTPGKINSLCYILFNAECRPYMNKEGEIAVLSRAIVMSAELGITSMEPHKEARTIQGFIKSHPLPKEKLHVRNTSSVRNFFTKIGIVQPEASEE